MGVKQIGLCCTLLPPLLSILLFLRPLLVLKLQLFCTQGNISLFPLLKRLQLSSYYFVPLVHVITIQTSLFQSPWWDGDIGFSCHNPFHRSRRSGFSDHLSCRDQYLLPRIKLLPIIISLEVPLHSLIYQLVSELIYITYELHYIRLFSVWCVGYLAVTTNSMEFITQSFYERLSWPTPRSFR